MNGTSRYDGADEVPKAISPSLNSMRIVMDLSFRIGRDATYIRDSYHRSKQLIEDTNDGKGGSPHRLCDIAMPHVYMRRMDDLIDGHT